jgi:hypothetical protein
VLSTIGATTAGKPGSIFANANTDLRMACSPPGVARDTNPMIDMQPSYGWLAFGCEWACPDTRESGPGRCGSRWQ